VKTSHRLYRIGALVCAILLPFGAVLATGIPQASAAGGAEYCTGPGGSDFWCLNAWNGGPFVNVFTGGPNGTPNNYFEDFCVVSTGICQIVDTGPNQSEGLCIGDAGNKSGNADTGLVGCTGWGTNFREQRCGIGVSFYNVHWKGYLGPPDRPVNGSHWYLNKPGPWCFNTNP